MKDILELIWLFIEDYGEQCAVMGILIAFGLVIAIAIGIPAAAIVWIIETVQQ